MNGAFSLSFDGASNANHIFTNSVSGGTLTFDNSILTSNQSRLNINYNGTIQANAQITGTQILTVKNPGANLYLNNSSNSFTGGIDIQSGEVFISSSGAQGSGTIFVNLSSNNSNFQNNTGGSITLSNAINFQSSSGASKALRLIGSSGTTTTFSSDSMSLDNGASAAGDTLAIRSLTGSTHNVKLSGTGFTAYNPLFLESGNVELTPASGTQTWNSIISGTGTLTHSGASEVILSGSNTHTGLTSVTGGGTLSIGNNSAIPGNLTITNGTLNIKSGVTYTPSTETLTAGAATITGQGTYSSALTIDDNVANRFTTVSAGTSLSGNTGTLTASSGTLYSGGTYIWDIDNAASGGTAGIDWDYLNFTGALDLSNLDASNKFTIDIRNIGSTGFSWGEGPGYTAEDTNGYKIMEASGGISGFNADYFTLDNSNWTDGGNWWFDWKIYENGNALFLSYNAVPEPSTWIIGIFLTIVISVPAIRKKCLK